MRGPDSLRSIDGNVLAPPCPGLIRWAARRKFPSTRSLRDGVGDPSPLGRRSSCVRSRQPGSCGFPSELSGLRRPSSTIGCQRTSRSWRLRDDTDRCDSGWNLERFPQTRASEFPSDSPNGRSVSQAGIRTVDGSVTVIFSPAHGDFLVIAISNQIYYLDIKFCNLTVCVSLNSLAARD
jgi:hypothetical protein